MEKYTVDIDKVLDDFEETEALKISTTHKHTEASLLQPSILTYEGDQINGNEGSDIDERVQKPGENIVNSCEKTLCLDSDLSLENTDTDVRCLNQLETSDNNAVINSNFNKITEIPASTLIKSDYTDSTSSGHLSMTAKNSDTTSNECVSVTETGISEIKIDKHDDSLTSDSVSVLEKNFDTGAYLSKVPVTGNISESHTVTENTLLMYDNPHDNLLIQRSFAMEFKDASCDNDIGESSQAAEGAANSSASNVDLVDELNGTANCTDAEDIKSAIINDDVLNCEFSEQKCDAELEGDINDDTSDTAGACCSVSGAEVSELPEENKLYDSQSISTAKDNSEPDKSDARPVSPERNSDDEIPAPFHRIEMITDDEEDSGVSSDEENKNPLLYFNNRMYNINRINISIRRNNGVGPPRNVFRPARLQVHQNNHVACARVIPEPEHDNEVPVYAVRVPDEHDNNVHEASGIPQECDKNVHVKAAKLPEVNECVDSPQPEGAKNEESDEIQENKADSSLSENVASVHSPNKFTGARPKSETLNQTPVDTCIVSTTEAKDSGNKVLKAGDMAECSEVVEIQGKNESEISVLDDCENSEDSDQLPINISTDTELVNSCCSNERDTKCNYEMFSANTESLTTDSEIENSVLTSDTKIDNFPHRLPRPTSLDLPSRHVAIAPMSDENCAVLPENNNLAPLTDPDFLSNEMAIEENTSEASQSVRQQPRIGLVKPFWIPDAEAPNCMHCGMKFNVLRRRHHCRACGKVLCSRCCNLRAKLAYLNKEDRICHPCFEILSSTPQNENISAPLPDSQSSSSCGSSPNFSPSPQIPNANFNDKNTWRPHPNNPDDYCSTIPPLQQIQLSGTRPPPTVMVPIGVLKRGNKPRREPKQVIFSDGIRPGGDLTDLTEPADVVPVYRRMGRKRVEKAISGESLNTSGSPVSILPSQRTRQKRFLVSDEEGPLPPVVLQIVDNEKFKDEKLDWNQLLERMQDDDQKPINFALLKNMHLFVKLTKLDCCYGKECWCFTSHGLCAVGQDEVMVILERLPEENTLPRGIIKLFTHIYDSASKGSTFEDLGHIIFPEQILGSSDHRGFLFVRPTFQCLSKLVVPNTPFLVGILIHKWEVPWAKVFPLRLMLRLGAECRYYPCALVSVRHRKPVFFEIGQTIMSVLSDLRNYQFTIPVIPGLVVHMEEKKTCVNIPRNRYEKVMKILNSNNVEHVLALGSNFSSEADSHLVCMQKEEGDYQTQAINIENTTRRVTGASFIVFSGALKSSSGLSAKFSIVEDGLLVQIPQETMVALHMALRDMKDITIECGQINATEPEEVVLVQWTRDDKKFNIGVRSPIDCKSLEGVPNVRIHTSTDYAGDNYLIRWTEVFFLEVDESSNSVQHELVDPCRLAETVAQSCCMALAPYLDQLAESELTKIGLRVTLDSERDRVEYDVGARGKPLPAMYMNALDCGLIPVILRLSGSAQSEPVSFELIFHILIK